MLVDSWLVAVLYSSPREEWGESFTFVLHYVMDIWLITGLRDNMSYRVLHETDAEEVSTETDMMPR